MFCGSNVDSGNKWNFAEVNKPKRILGVYVGKNENEATRTNWEIVITKTKNILNLWKARGLTLKGRVIVTNALVLSKINHIMGVCELPQWALNSLNSVISSFLWRGKGNLIAHRVLIANKREGGLGQIDIGAKKDALRAKLISKFLDPNRHYPWEDALASQLSNFGLRDVRNLCILHPEKVVGELKPFYREIVEAWGKLLPHLMPICRNKEDVFRLPFLKNPCFLHKGKTITSSHLMEAGLLWIRDIMDDDFSVKLDFIFGVLKNKNINFRKCSIRSITEKIKNTVTLFWERIMQTKDISMQNDDLNFLLCQNNNPVSVQEIKTKAWYKLLIAEIKRTPTTEKIWAQIFPGFNTKSIWTSGGGLFTPPTLQHLDFKIKHRRIFTGIVLHQINKGKYERKCKKCNEQDEDLEHLFLDCSLVRAFYSTIRRTIQSACNFHCGSDTEWTLLFLFGLKKNSAHQHTHIINTILSYTRFSVWTVRNYALYENRTLSLLPFFKTLFLNHLKNCFFANPDTFNQLLNTGHNLFTVHQNSITLNL
ncbi:uncharacterized protein mettl17 isoform X1 [Xyrichtys novacula]|uniref:Uncharacterized protein mettl17 isoform X1 n=1 Tax=Xyrichtys novacula TaxID=13765 RepID=A0AAV1GZE9_XYRNO|nr:uncharacterized protein mettl17 isoform X1 [Xyrichtys novacula]